MGGFIQIPFSNKNNKGFTFIELLIYIGILAVVLVVVFNFGWEIIYGNVKSQAIREAQQNARFAMEKIVRETKRAKSINGPNPGESASTLSLEMMDSNLNPTVFDVSGGKLRIIQGTSGPYELTNNRVVVSNLQFINLSYENTPGTIRVEMIVEHVNPNNRSEYAASFGLNSTVSLTPEGAGVVEEGYCQGTPSACNSFGDRASCENQEGCSWALGNCGGTCTPCKQLGFLQCLSQGGCTWNLKNLKCQGNCTSCGSYSEQGSCESQLGCSWLSPYCAGTATPCEDYTTQVSCTSQEGCEWIIP